MYRMESQVEEYTQYPLNTPDGSQESVHKLDMLPTWAKFLHMLTVNSSPVPILQMIEKLSAKLWGLFMIVHDLYESGYKNSTEICNLTYIPTVNEFFEGLGAFGIIFLIIGSVTTVVLYGLFIQQMWFTFSHTHKAYRRHIYWLISIYPFMALMSTLTLIVPRSYRICNAVKITYMSIGVAHFADLTIMMHGSENKMIEDLKGKKMKLDLMPLCCAFKCLPNPPVTKYNMRATLYMCFQLPYTQFIYHFLNIYLFAAEVIFILVGALSFIKWMVWQMKWTQGLYYIVFNIWTTGLQNKEGEVDPEVSFLWLSILNFASFLSGVWALNIMCDLSAEYLEKYNYRKKSLAVKVLILTTKFQNFFFVVLGNNGVYPCLSQYITPTAFQIALENAVYLIEMTIFGLFSYFMYRDGEFQKYRQPTLLPHGQYTEGGIVFHTEESLTKHMPYSMNITEQPSATQSDLTSSSFHDSMNSNTESAFGQLDYNNGMESQDGKISSNEVDV